jgi:hypothetical protein
MRCYCSAAVIGAAAVTVVGLGGCASHTSDIDSTGASARTAGAQVQVGDVINYGSFGTIAEIDCADGLSLKVGGSNNTLKVTGKCARVSIGGAENEIVLATIEKNLSVVGLNNTVTYKAGDPKVDKLGSGNEVKKG